MDEIIKSCLFPILNTNIDDEIIQYIKQMKNSEDFDEFIDNIIDRANPEHVHNYEKLKNNLFNTGKVNVKSKNNSSNQSTVAQPRRDPIEAFPSLPTPKNGSLFIAGSNNKKDVSQKVEIVKSGAKGKKSKYVNIESLETTVGNKKGRSPCDCEARTHSLINNCMNCGRIVCSQEGSGPCFFCDNMVCTNEELSILDSNSKLSDKLYNQLREQRTSKEWKKAIEVRNKLLKADKSGEYKRAIYDDQGDYYEGNRWKSDNKSKEHLRSGIHKSRNELKMALDFATRTFVIEIDDNFEKNKNKFLKGVDKLLDTSAERFPKDTFKNLHENGNKIGKELPKLTNLKVANESFLAEIDRGMCLSMHQPWASLLVAGIKLHEGRTWHTNHRGRLWIHAASKQPESNDILEVEEMYKNIYCDPDLQFPKQYPTGCLLGCVFVEDCLNQTDYQKYYSNGESDSLYVLICNNPMILPVFFPMQGQHKIFSLSREVHKKAREGIMAAKWL